MLVSPRLMSIMEYEYKSNALVGHKFLITKKLAFLTTFGDLGFGYSGYLNVFDLAKKRPSPVSQT